MPTQVRQRLPHDRTAPAEARRALEPLRDRVDPRRLDELRLLVSELVTNAVRHGAPVEDNGVELAVSVDRRKARVEVVDGGGGFTAPRGRSGPGGWGLMVVDRLADRWGVETDRGTRVWLEFSLLTDAASV